MGISRHLMKEGVTSDSARMFALLSSLCQSPITWYTSGPAQKFILRQIRGIDTTYLASLKSRSNAGGNGTPPVTDDVRLDVCLLMLYGHILFTSTSYTYAIGKRKAHGTTANVIIELMINRVLSACARS